MIKVISTKNSRTANQRKVLSHLTTTLTADVHERQLMSLPARTRDRRHGVVRTTAKALKLRSSRVNSISTTSRALDLPLGREVPSVQKEGSG